MAEDMNGYPKIQVSFFLGDPRGKNQQVVVRGESAQEIADQMEALTTTVGDEEAHISRIINALNAVQAANMLIATPNYSQEPPQQNAPAQSAPRQNTWGNRQNYSNGSNSGGNGDFQCNQCGAPAERRSGEKNGKPWSGIFCSQNKQHVQWGK